MMQEARRRSAAEFKARFALDALPGEHTLSGPASKKHGVHANQVSQWKGQTSEQTVADFPGRPGRAGRAGEALIEKLRSFMPRSASF